VAASSNPHLIQLITTVDRDIRANQKVIHELHHTNECLLIKFSEDVKELFANAPTPTITKVQHTTGQQTRPESSTRNLQEPTLQRNDGGTPRSTQTMRLSSLSHTTDFITCSHIYCLFIIATAPQLFIHGLLSFVYIQTAAQTSSDLAGPSHTETATVQVEQPADATQPIAGPGTF